MTDRDALQFIGERNRPLRVEEVIARNPVLGTGEAPKQFLEQANRRSIHFYTANEKERPNLELQLVEQQQAGALWRVDIPVEHEPGGAGALLGKSAVRQSSEAFLQGINSKASFTGYRPEWVNQLYTPRSLPQQYKRSMRRINGRPIDPMYVFGADDRRIYRDASWPWGLVGKIFNSDGYVGTGALIGRNIVVTCGHLVPWNRSSWWMRFVPAYYDGASLHGSGIESYVSDARGYDTSGDVTGYDWAILKLYNPLGDWLGYFGYNGYSSDWEDEPYWTVVGYPGAVASGQRPSYQSGVSVFDDDSDSNGGVELETQADMTPGNSGGPMFGWWSGDPRIIGVVSGQEEDWHFPFSFVKGNVVAGGSGFTNLIAWGRSNW